MPAGKTIGRIAIKKFIVNTVWNSKVLVAASVHKIDLQRLRLIIKVNNF